jgi:hypothetical protein
MFFGTFRHASSLFPQPVQPAPRYDPNVIALFLTWLRVRWVPGWIMIEMPCELAS